MGDTDVLLNALHPTVIYSLWFDQLSDSELTSVHGTQQFLDDDYEHH